MTARRKTSPRWQKSLRKYQLEGAEWLPERVGKYTKGRMLSDPPGFGKTVQALAASRKLIEEGNTQDQNIIAITTALSRADWAREAKRYWPELPVHVVSLDEARYRRKGESEEDYYQRKIAPMLKAIAPGAPPALVVTSYESAEKLLIASQEAECFFGTLNVDEAHLIKKPTSAYSRVVRQISSRAERTLLYTGTPIHNRCEDLHNLLDTICPGIFGTKYAFAGRYFELIRDARGYGSVVGGLQEGAKERLSADLKPYVLARSVEDAFGELPPRIRKLVKVQCPSNLLITKEQMRSMQDKGLDKALRTACTAKLKAGVELLLQLDEPTVVYVQERKHARQLQAMLAKKKVESWLAMGGSASEGGTTADARTQLIARWQDEAGAPSILICTMEAVKESATLTRASAMVFLDLDWLPGKQLQCEGRIDPSRQREGERRPARYYYVVLEGGPDEVVAGRVMEKIAQADGVIGKAGAGEAVALKGMMAGLAKGTVMVESAEDALADLIGRLNARAERMDAVGLSYCEEE